MDTFKVGNRAACRCASTSARPSSIVPPDLVRGGTGAAAGGRHRVLIERRDRSSSDRSGEAAAMAAVATTGSAGGPGAAGRRERELGAPSARSLLVTVLGEFLLPAGGWVWTGTLVGVLGVLGIEASACRAALASMPSTPRTPTNVPVQTHPPAGSKNSPSTVTNSERALGAPSSSGRSRGGRSTPADPVVATAAIAAAGGRHRVLIERRAVS